MDIFDEQSILFMALAVVAFMAAVLSASLLQRLPTLALLAQWIMTPKKITLALHPKRTPNRRNDTIMLFVVLWCVWLLRYVSHNAPPQAQAPTVPVPEVRPTTPRTNVEEINPWVPGYYIGEMTPQEIEQWAGSPIDYDSTDLTELAADLTDRAVPLHQVVEIVARRKENRAELEMTINGGMSADSAVRFLLRGARQAFARPAPRSNPTHHFHWPVPTLLRSRFHQGTTKKHNIVDAILGPREDPAAMIIHDTFVGSSILGDGLAQEGGEGNDDQDEGGDAVLPPPLDTDAMELEESEVVEVVPVCPEGFGEPKGKATGDEGDVDVDAAPIAQMSNDVLDSMKLGAGTATFRVYGEGAGRVRAQDRGAVTRIETMKVDGEDKAVANVAPASLSKIVRSLQPLPPQVLGGLDLESGNRPKREQIDMLAALKVEYDLVKGDATHPDPMRLRTKYSGQVAVNALIPADWDGTNLEYIKEAADQEAARDGQQKEPKKWFEALSKFVSFIKDKGRLPKMVARDKSAAERTRDEQHERTVGSWMSKQQNQFKNRVNGEKLNALSTERLIWLTAVDFPFTGANQERSVARFAREFTAAMEDVGRDFSAIVYGYDENPWVTKYLKKLFENHRLRGHSDRTTTLYEDLGVDFSFSFSDSREVQYHREMRVQYREYMQAQRANGMADEDVYVMYPRACVGEYAPLRRLARFTWNLMKRVQEVEFDDERFESYHTKKELKKLKEKQRANKIDPLSALEAESKGALEAMGFNFYPEKAHQRERRVEWRRAAYQYGNWDSMMQELAEQGDAQQGDEQLNNVRPMDLATFYDEELPPHKKRPDTLFSFRFNEERPSDSKGPTPRALKAAVLDETDERAHAPYTKPRQRNWETSIVRDLRAKGYSAIYILRVNTGFRRTPNRLQELEVAKIKKEIFSNPKRGVHFIALDFFEKNKHVLSSFARKIPEGADEDRTQEDDVDKRPLYNTVKKVYSGIPRSMF